MPSYEVTTREGPGSRLKLPHPSPGITVWLSHETLVGSLRSYDGNCNENVSLKLNFALS